MPSFAIEIYQPGVTEPVVVELVRRVRQIVSAMAIEGSVVDYVGCTLSPADEVCFVRLDGATRHLVEEVARRMDLHDARVTEMFELDES